MQARDVMTSPVITTRPDTPARLAMDLLVSHGFSAVPVVDAENTVVGIVSEADLLREGIVSGRSTVERQPEPTVDAVMTKVPVVVDPEEDLADVVALMLDRGFRSVPITADGALVGIVTHRDILRCVARRQLTSPDQHARRTEMAGRERGGPAPAI